MTDISIALNDALKAKEKSRSPAQLSAVRVYKAVLADLMTETGSNSLSPLASGCLMTIVRFICFREPLVSLGSSMLAKEAQALLSMKGVHTADSELVLLAWQMAGLTKVNDDTIEIPTLDRVIHTERKLLTNRVSGWAKRDASANVALISAEVADKANVLPIVQESKNATPSQNFVDAPKRKSPSEKKLNSETTRRFCSTDYKETEPQNDPVMVRICCENGKIAEITSEYVDHLQSNFKRLDVLEQLRRASLWCESNPTKRKTYVGIRRFLNSWLGNASREFEVRNAVVRAGNQKNGFGQGGDYESPTCSVDILMKSQPVPDVGNKDDFTDLFSLQIGDPSSAFVVDHVQSVKASTPPGLSADLPVRANIVTTQDAVHYQTSMPTSCGVSKRTSFLHR